MEHGPILPLSATDQAHECHLQTLNDQLIRHNKTLAEMLFHLDSQIGVLLGVKHHAHNTADRQPGQAIFLSKHLCHWRETAKVEYSRP